MITPAEPDISKNGQHEPSPLPSRLQFLPEGDQIISEPAEDAPRGEKPQYSPKSIPATQSKEDEPEDKFYAKGWRLFFILTALLVSVFCEAVDETIIATAIPRITDHFHRLDDVGWYGSAYLLTNAAFQLFFGKVR